MSVINRPYFQNEKAAFAHLEKTLWNEGVVCPHCGSVDSARRLQGVKDKKGNVRNGLWKCYAKECRKQFTVRVGTVFEDCKIPLHKCLQAVYLMTASKKGISSHQLHRILEITYKSAWFLTHRIREAMRDGSFSPMGGGGKVVEIDETIFGKVQGAPKRLHRGGFQFRNIVLTLVERGGSARSFHVDGTTVGTLIPIIRMNIKRESALHTDQASWYRGLKGDFGDHQTVNHQEDEYVRGDVTTNTVEGFYSIFKRGMKGVYQHCAEKHLHRYLAEFDFRYSNRVALGCDDGERAVRAMKGIVGKRLTYRTPNQECSV
jgi:transposase-like protein